VASDSRITWGSEFKRWDAGRKLFACKATADIFGYVGEVFFPSLVLGQITAAADDHLIFRAEDDAETRHAAVVRTVKTSFDSRHNVDDEADFHIIHGARNGENMDATFRVWQLSHFKKRSTTPAYWTEEEFEVSSDHSSDTG
jgi:hypothetical protein